MRPIKILVAVLALAFVPLAAQAQKLIGSYVAYIGWEDLHNSNGQRLTQYWQIIRQDRANFHRFGIRHDGDQWDPFFADANNRATLERLVMNSGIDSHSRRMITQGNTPVFVEIFGWGNQISSVRVQVPG